ncbi:MAG TPA: carboxypeptidase regulatory-like domain-containing protein [Pyrinomonadaceae bacterium]|nr:carboxypeptidase regulatory-like domain-containing protein [Pyrinomonadaceae bacterium]
MRNISRLLNILSLFSLLAIVCAAQVPAKDTSASVAGRVTVGGKPGVGVTIVATVSNSFFDNKTVAKTTADEEGNYKLAGLAAGRLTVLPLAKSYLLASGGAYKEAGQTVNVAAGETVTKIDFALVRGGVITGRITDAEGHPLIGESVSIALKDSGPDTSPQVAMFGSSKNQTDDRGVFRVYGLAPGSYKVSVGQAASSGGAVSIMGIGGSQYLKTFYPGVLEDAKATILEIKEGTELKEIDIRVGKPGGGYAVSGRVIDSESGSAVPNLYLGHSTMNESNQEMGRMNFTGHQTDANGKFRLEGLRPGRYAVYTFAAGQTSTSYSEPVQFEISDSDVTGIEIKVRRGATISGVAVIENSSDPAVVGLLQKVSLYAYVEQKGLAAPSYGTSQIGADGGFHMEGLAPGKARIVVQGFPSPPEGLSLIRTEVDGLDQPAGIELTAGAQVKGVRLVFAFGSGSVRGDVKMEGGPVPDGMQLQALIRSAAGEARRFTRMAELDGRLHFVLENIPAGDYELVIRGITRADQNAPTPPIEFLSQPITITNGIESKVSLTVDVNSKKGGRP